MKKHLYADLYQLEETHFWHRLKRQLLLRLIQKYSPLSNPKILDMGCGTGKNVETFNSIGQAYGVDLSPEAIKFCHRRHLSRIYQEPVEKTHFKASSFDVITLLDVLEHVQDKKTVKEAYRLLKPDGVLIITVPAYPWMWSRWDEELFHHRRYTKSSLLSLFPNFKIQKISYFNSFLLLPAFFVRAIKTTIYKNKPYPSDFSHSSPLLTPIIRLQSFFENRLLEFTTIPFGLSLLLVARKTK